MASHNELTLLYGLRAIVGLGRPMHHIPKSIEIHMIGVKSHNPI